MAQPRDEKPQSPAPSPGSSPSPSPGDQARSDGSPRASAKASQADAGAFVGDPGPAFDPGAEQPPEPEQPPELAALPTWEPEWDEEALERFLIAQGELAHAAVGVAENDWRHTEADLKAIAPPLSRILNRYPVTRAAAASQDPLALVIATSAYAVRSRQERVRALRALAEAEGPVTGVEAPPGAEPPPGHPLHEPPSPAPAGEDEIDPDRLDWQRA